MLGRWSYPFFAALLGVGTLWLASLIGVWRRERTGRSTPGRRAGETTLDFAVLCWGAAYLIGTFDRGTTVGASLDAGRIIDLNLFGSASPVGAVLAWIAALLMAVAG